MAKSKGFVEIRTVCLEAISQAGGQKLTPSLRNSYFFALWAGAESCWKIQGPSPWLWASTCLIQGIRVSLIPKLTVHLSGHAPELLLFAHLAQFAWLL